MRERSRLLRKNQTEAETTFWNIVRKRKFYGFRFHRQYVLHGYILDFVCFQKLLVIEFDGQHHYFSYKRYKNQTEEESIKNFKYIQQNDQIKNEYCKNNNIDLLRIPYWEKENIEEILKNKLIEFM